MLDVWIQGYRQVVRSVIQWKFVLVKMLVTSFWRFGFWAKFDILAFTASSLHASNESDKDRITI
jgi:hypothetical protein